MKLKKLSVLMAVPLIFTVGCTEKKQRDIFAMDTYMSITAYGNNADKAIDKATEKITELESLLDVNSEKSDVWKINDSNGNSVQISDDTAEIINSAIKFCDSTQTLDITIYPVLKEWGFTTGNYKIPEANKLDKLLKNVDYRNIKLDGNNISIPENYMIDLGAIAKGYTGDEVIAELRENGAESAIISLGGNVQTFGSKPGGSDWKISVTNPFKPDSSMCMISVGEKAVVTSGSYERFFTGSDGRKYHHIIDKSDGYPADNGLVSVTIIGDSGLMCDALSTALFIAGTENAAEFWRKNRNFDMILVTDDCKIMYTDGLEDTLENVSNMPAEVISND